HSIERPEKRRFAASRWPDEGGDLIGLELDGNVFQNAVRPVVEIHVRDVDLRGRRRGRDGMRRFGWRRGERASLRHQSSLTESIWRRVSGVLNQPRNHEITTN